MANDKLWLSRWVLPQSYVLKSNTSNKAARVLKLFVIAVQGFSFLSRIRSDQRVKLIEAAKAMLNHQGWDEIISLPESS